MKPFNMYFVSVISQKKNLYILKIKGCPGSTVIKISACQCTRCRFDPWVRKIPWRRKWQPTPVFLPGESHGQRIWWATVPGVAESDMTDSHRPTPLLPPMIILELLLW